MSSQSERPEGLPALFSSAWLVDNQLHVPAGPGVVVFNLTSRRITGPGPDGRPVDLPMDGLTTFTIDHRQQEGDLKVHHYYTVSLSNGPDCIVVTERAKEYHEYHREVDAEYHQTLAAIHALPGLLGVAAQVAQPEHAPADPRSPYARRPSSAFAPRQEKPKQEDGWVVTALLGGLVLVGLWLLRRR
jgi:hypothetical protein